MLAMLREALTYRQYRCTLELVERGSLCPIESQSSRTRLN